MILRDYEIRYIYRTDGFVYIFSPYFCHHPHFFYSYIYFCFSQLQAARACDIEDLTNSLQNATHNCAPNVTFCQSSCTFGYAKEDGMQATNHSCNGTSWVPSGTHCRRKSFVVGYLVRQFLKVFAYLQKLLN